MSSTRTSLPSAAEARADLRRELRRDARILGGILAVLWGVLLVDRLGFGGQLRAFGIVPRTVPGLWGVLFAPLLHSGVAHLLLNSGGFVVFAGLVLLRAEKHFWAVTGIGALVGGLGTWAFGRPVPHVGASGVLFAYFGYLLLTGVFERRLGSVLLSVCVALAWGGVLLQTLPGQPGVSWESHLFGFAAGALAARLLARRRTPALRRAR
jgi:membrane associated rhomboid family serine protease